VRLVCIHFVVSQCARRDTRQAFAALALVLAGDLRGLSLLAARLNMSGPSLLTAGLRPLPTRLPVCLRLLRPSPLMVRLPLTLVLLPRVLLLLRIGLTRIIRTLFVLLILLTVELALLLLKVCLALVEQLLLLVLL
jgi:hypothetical protein